MRTIALESGEVNQQSFERLVELGFGDTFFLIAPVEDGSFESIALLADFGGQATVFGGGNE